MPELTQTQKRLLEVKETPGRLMEYYSSRLRMALNGFKEKDAIVEEFQQHIRQRAQTGSLIRGENLAKNLWEFGDPHEIAAKYRAHAWLVRASTSWSPWMMLRATIGWARVGVKGVGVGLILFLGYGAALLSFGCASLKHFLSWRFEHEVGRAVALVLGSAGSADSGVTEFLVSWLPLLGVALGIFFLIATTCIVRFLIRRVAGPDN